MSLSTEQWGALLAPLDPGRVQKLKGQSHLEAWDVRRWLIRIFGVGGWDFEVVSCELVRDIEYPYVDKKTGKVDETQVRHTVVYRVLGRLVVRDLDGRELAHYEDGATGDAVNQPSIGDAHDMALKTAMSQALKRCAANLGDQFGLSLYNGGSTRAVVARSIPSPAPPAVQQQDEPVQSDQSEAVAEKTPADNLRDGIRALAVERSWDLKRVAAAFESDYGEPLKSCQDVERLNTFFQQLEADARAEEEGVA